jgi:hypothetical protein
VKTRNQKILGYSVLAALTVFFAGSALADDPAPMIERPHSRWAPTYSLYDPRANNMPDSGLAGGAEGNLNLTTGNVLIRNIGASAAVGYRAESFTTTAKASLMTLKNRSTELNEAILGQTRVGMNATKGLDFFVQGLFFRNPFTGVRQQYHGDAGFGLYPVTTDNLEIRLEVAAGYLRENITYGLRDTFATGRGGVGLKFKLSETADFLADGSWIHNFEDSGDHRVITTAAISTAVTQLLSLKVGFNYMFRNEALAGFKAHDSATTASLVLKL